jgi:hypothetical protein
MKFPYYVVPAKPDAAFLTRKSIKRPILAVVLEKNGKSIAALAIVDSGADSCIFPASLASALGITIPNQNVYVFSGTAEEPQLAYFETVRATIWNRDNKDQPFQFDLYAGFCETLEHVGLGLLGQEGLFSSHQVQFHHAQNYFDIF